MKTNDFGFKLLPWTDDTKGYWFEKLDTWIKEQVKNNNLLDIKTFQRSEEFGDKPCSLEEYCEEVYKVVTGYYPSVKLPLECIDDEDKYNEFIKNNLGYSIDISDQIL